MQQFESWLRESGVQVDSPFNGSVGHASTDGFYLKYNREQIEIGIRQHFDRWRNSADFILKRIPPDLVGIKALLAAVKYCVETGVYEAEMDQVDIYSLYRKERKKLIVEDEE